MRLLLFAEVLRGDDGPDAPPAPPRETKRQTGRPPQGESDKAQLVLAALVKHHDWEPNGSVGEPTPARGKYLAKLASNKHVKVSPSTVSRFFAKKFPGRGHKGYESACVRGKIGALLTLWRGDFSEEHLADLLSHESGRGDD
jgi:hypothetical protein